MCGFSPAGPLVCCPDNLEIGEEEEKRVEQSSFSSQAVRWGLEERGGEGMESEGKEEEERREDEREEKLGEEKGLQSLGTPCITPFDCV